MLHALSAAKRQAQDRTPLHIADYPIERLAVSRDRAVLASASHDNTVKLWDLGALEDGSDEEDEGEAANTAAEQHAGECNQVNMVFCSLPGCVFLHQSYLEV